MTHNAPTSESAADPRRARLHRRVLIVAGLTIVAVAVAAQAAMSLSGVVVFNGATVLVLAGVVLGGLLFGRGRGEA